MAVVTGAGSAIGRATAVAFAAAGYAVACLDVNGEAAAASASAIGDAARAVQCDVSAETSVAGAVAQVVDDLGRIDVLANVAGIGGSVRFEDVTLTRWQRTLAVNLTGTYLMCAAALPHLEQTSGAIVNVASVAGLTGIAFAADYAASKGGVVALSRALAVELSDRGIRVRCICPAGVDTAMVDQFRLPEGATVPPAIRRARGSKRPLLSAEEVAAAIADAAVAAPATGDDVVVVLGGAPPPNPA